MTKRLLVSSEIIFANVVLPVPDGPYSNKEGTLSSSIMERRNVPGPTTCSCPKKWSNERGRIRTAKGSNGSTGSIFSNKFITTPPYIYHHILTTATLHALVQTYILIPS